MQEAVEGSSVSDLGVWKRSKMKKASNDKGKGGLMYGKAETDLQNYTAVFTQLHPEVDDPLEVEVDERAVIIAGRGREHGRVRVLNSVFTPTTSLTRIRATSTSDDPAIPPRPRPGGSSQPTVDVRSFSFPLSDIRFLHGYVDDIFNF
jgi:hypothetical protein